MIPALSMISRACGDVRTSPSILPDRRLTLGRALYLDHADATSCHEALCSAASGEPCPSTSPDRATERGVAPQADPHLRARRLWQDHARRRLADQLRTTVRLAIP